MRRSTLVPWELKFITISSIQLISKKKVMTNYPCPNLLSMAQNLSTIICIEYIYCTFAVSFSIISNCSVTWSVSALCWGGNRVDSRPKPNHSERLKVEPTAMSDVRQYEKVISGATNHNAQLELQVIGCTIKGLVVCNS